MVEYIHRRLVDFMWQYRRHSPNKKTLALGRNCLKLTHQLACCLASTQNRLGETGAITKYALAKLRTDEANLHDGQDQAAEPDSGDGHAGVDIGRRVTRSMVSHSQPLNMNIQSF